MNIWKAILKRRRRILITCGIPTAVVLGVLIAAFALLDQALSGLDGAFRNGCKVDQPGGMDKTESLGQFAFPPSARNVSAYCAGMQGWGLDAAFGMSPTDLSAFQSTTRIAPAQWMTSLPPAGSIQPYSLPTRDLFTWSEGMQSLLYGAYSVVEFSQEILIDTSNPTLFRVKILVLGG